jgi:hypothetical protein
MEEYELGLRKARYQVADLIQIGSRKEAIEMSNSSKGVETAYSLSDCQLLKHSVQTAEKPVCL